jgi:hypothetical protein
MAQLTTAERLAKVKTALYGDATPTYNDGQLQIFIDDVIAELIDGGVKKEVAESAAAVGCIACGVTDIWNYTSGGVKHSEYFNRRLVQLSLKRGGGNVSTE